MMYTYMLVKFLRLEARKKRGLYNTHAHTRISCYT